MRSSRILVTSLAAVVLSLSLLLTMLSYSALHRLEHSQALPITTDSGPQSAAVQKPAPATRSKLWWWLLLFWVYCLCFGAVAFFSSNLIKNQFAPLASVQRFSRKLAEGDTDQRLQLNGEGQLPALVQDLNQLAEQLDGQRRQLLQLSFRDSLTGLANRNQFFLWLKQAAAAAQPFALLMMDLDQFKRVNDSLGYESGDQLLLAVADRLQGAMASLCQGEFRLARFSGDEYGILLLGDRAGEIAESVAQGVQMVMAESFSQDGHEFQVGGSIGISLYPQDGDTPPQLLKNAEMAMYQAKADGPCGYRFFAEFMGLSAIKRMTVEMELGRAIENSELRLYYQPKFDVGERVMVGSEALLRWQHPKRGLIGPDYFLEVAEQTGLIGPIGQWVCAEVCRQLAAWEGTPLGRLPVAFNLSAAEFNRRDVAADLQRELQRHQVEPSLVQVEITETTIASNEARVGAELEQLRQLGVKVWIDDFGTGYSSLGYLRRFAVDGVKIDRSFVSEVAHNPADANLCGAIVAMASQLQLAVVAEGVETRAQYNLLEQSGCAQAQGFFYARPISPEVLGKQAGHLLQLEPLHSMNRLREDINKELGYL